MWSCLNIWVLEIGHTYITLMADVWNEAYNRQCNSSTEKSRNPSCLETFSGTRPSPCDPCFRSCASQNFQVWGSDKDVWGWLLWSNQTALISVSHHFVFLLSQRLHCNLQWRTYITNDRYYSLRIFPQSLTKVLFGEGPCEAWLRNWASTNITPETFSIKNETFR